MAPRLKWRLRKTSNVGAISKRPLLRNKDRHRYFAWNGRLWCQCRRRSCKPADRPADKRGYRSIIERGFRSIIERGYWVSLRGGVGIIERGCGYHTAAHVRHTTSYTRHTTQNMLTTTNQGFLRFRFGQVKCQVAILEISLSRFNIRVSEQCGWTKCVSKCSRAKTNTGNKPQWWCTECRQSRMGPAIAKSA